MAEPVQDASKGETKPDQPKGDVGLVGAQLDWGSAGGKLWECWVCQPCCSGYCCITWFCCGSCNTCHMWAWAQDQPCAIINHCLPVCFCGPCAACSVRSAVRTKAGLPAGGPINGFLGDCLASYCCGPCSACQQCRAAHNTGGKESWDFFGNPKPKCSNPEFKCPPFK